MDDAALVSSYDSALERYPLETAVLWHRDLPRTSQRMICAPASDPKVDAVLVSGGHGTGKTHLTAMLAVAHAAGRRAPWVRAWAEVNGFPLERLPDRMGRVLVSGLTGHDIRRFLKPKVSLYLPKGSKWRNEDGDGESEVILPGAPDKMLGRIVFKSNDQQARSYQGDWWDFIGLDEEHDHDVFNECLERIGRVPGGMGWMALTMTPLKGRTWVWREFVNAAPPNYRAFALHTYDNPHLPVEKLERIAGRYGAHEEAARRRGEFVVLEGAVYPMWSRAIHVIPPFDIPADWPRFRAWDPGTRNPTSVGWYALDTKDDVLHRYRGHYRSGWTLSQHAEHVKAQETADWYWTVVDSAAAGDRLSLATEHGIENLEARKDIRRGINACAERLMPDAEGRPHFVVHDVPSNQDFIREIEGYIWASRGGQQDQPDLPLKANDHAMDEWRYQCMALSRSEFARVVSEPTEDEGEAA